VRPYHREIARRLVLGQRQSDICVDLGISTGRLSIIVNSPLFKLELKRLEDIRDKGVEDVTRSLKNLAPVALEQIERTMYTAKSEKLRTQCAWDILDRAGYKATDKVEVRTTNLNINVQDYSDDELKEIIKQRLERLRSSQRQFITESDSQEISYGNKILEMDLAKNDNN